MISQTSMSFQTNINKCLLTKIIVLILSTFICLSTKKVLFDSRAVSCITNESIIKWAGENSVAVDFHYFWVKFVIKIENN